MNPKRTWPYTICTNAQWEEIERSLQRARAGPLTKNEINRIYFASSICRAGKKPDFWRMLCRRDREDCQLWREAAICLAEAEKHLRALEEQSDLANHVARDAIAPLVVLREKAEFLAAHKLITATYFYDQTIKNELRGALPEKLAKLATHNSNNWRAIFYEHLADLWEQRGGRLTTTWRHPRHPRRDPSGKDDGNHEVSGAFVEFFESVARPLMGAAMPSRHTILGDRS